MTDSAPGAVPLCPWCKKPVEVSDHPTYPPKVGLRRYAIDCLNEKCPVTPHAGYFETKRQAIEAWGRSVSSPPAPGIEERARRAAKEIAGRIRAWNGPSVPGGSARETITAIILSEFADAPASPAPRSDGDAALLREAAEALERLLSDVDDPNGHEDVIERMGRISVAWQLIARLRAAASAPAPASAERERAFEEAAEALDRCADVIGSDSLLAVTQFAAAHGYRYTGPSYPTEEIRAVAARLRAAASAPAAEPDGSAHCPDCIMPLAGSGGRCEKHRAPSSAERERASTEPATEEEWRIWETSRVLAFEEAAKIAEARANQMARYRAENEAAASVFDELHNLAAALRQRAKEGV